MRAEAPVADERASGSSARHPFGSCLLGSVQRKKLVKGQGSRGELSAGGRMCGRYVGRSRDYPSLFLDPKPKPLDYPVESLLPSLSREIMQRLNDRSSPLES